MAKAAERAEAAPKQVVDMHGHGHGHGHVHRCGARTCAHHTHPCAKQLLGPGWHVMGDLRKLTKRARRVSARAEAGAEAGERRAAGGEQASLKEEAMAAGYELEAEAEAEAAAGGDAEEEAGAAAEAAAAGAGAIDPMRGCVGSLRQLVRLSDFVASNLAERQTKGDRSEIAFHVGQVPRRHQHARTHARTHGTHGTHGTHAPSACHPASSHLTRCCATASTATARPSSAGSAGRRWT